MTWEKQQRWMTLSSLLLSPPPPPYTYSSSHKESEKIKVLLVNFSPNPFIYQRRFYRKEIFLCEKKTKY